VSIRRTNFPDEPKNGEAQIFLPRSFLEVADIAVVEDGAMIELDDFCLGAATEVENSPAPARDLLRAGSF
jgi:hypothetical protein